MEERKERFFKVVEGSTLHKKYVEWQDHKKKMVDLAEQFIKENKLETKVYIPLVHKFLLKKWKLNYRTKKWLDKQLRKKPVYINAIQFYDLKPNSELMMGWKALLKENGIEKSIYKPSVEPYLKNVGKYKYRYFDQEGVIYYTQTNCGEWHDEDCLIEISEEEYNNIMKEYDERVSNVNDDEEKVVR